MGDELQVVIAGTTYSLVELPRTDTQLVVAEREALLGQIDLKALVQDLGLVGKCIRVAYNGVTAAGPKFTKLQIEAQELGYDVTKLCDKSAITVSKFKRACTTILSDLQTTYVYLLDNFEYLALETLAAVSKIAGQMAAAAEQLHKDFEHEVMKVRGVAKKTKREHGAQATLVQELKQEEKELKIKHKHQEEVLEDARKAEEEAERRYREYEMKEDKAIEKLGRGKFLTKVANALTSRYLGTHFFGEDPGTKQEKVGHWREKKREVLEKRKERESMRKEAYQQLTDFAVSIGRCNGEKEMAEAAMEALHKAMDGLQRLAALMMQAALFWKQMQEHCKALGEDRMKQTVEHAMQRYNNDERHELWTSTGFKRNAVRFYASWVALDSVCGEYMLAIQETQKDLKKYITENPSYEQAEINVKQLATELWKELQEVQKAIEERDSKINEEIRSLEDSEMDEEI